LELIRGTLDQAAARYDKYRPKVHGVIKEWLRNAGCKDDFSSAVDIACGTGDSTLPLLELSNNVKAIDISKSMLKYASDKGIDSFQLPYQNAHQLGKFSLITTSVASTFIYIPSRVTRHKSVLSVSRSEDQINLALISQLTRS